MSVAVLDRASRSPIVVRTVAERDPADAYVAAHPSASTYHDRAWLDVIRKAFGHDTTYLVAEAGSVVTGVLPLVFFRSRLFGRFTVSMPFLNYGGILADGPDAERALLDRAVEETRRTGGTHLELRHTRQRFSELTPKRHKVAMELSLHRTADAQWLALDKKLRNQVRKAEKSALDVRVGGI